MDKIKSTQKIIKPTKLQGTIIPPPAKAVSHRAWIFGAFGEKGRKISNLLVSEDIRATKEALEKMGAEFKQSQNEVQNNTYQSYELLKPAFKAGGTIDCLNSGTTLRLLTGISSLFDGQTKLIGDNSLMTRPMGPLITSLKELGATITSKNGKPPVIIDKPISQDKYETKISGDVSSQFISSLMLLSSLRDGITTKIHLIPPVVSKPYIDLTTQLLQKNGIIIKNSQGDEGETIIEILGRKNLGNMEIQVPSDMSSVAFYAVAGALPGNKIAFKNLTFDLPQADAKIIDIVKAAGAEVEINGTHLTITGKELHGVEFDISQCPDLFPILCVLGAYAKGKSKFYNAKHLRIKETDRIKASLYNLKQVGIKFEELEDGAIIYGGEVNGNVELKSFHDHRIAMAATILASQATDKIILNDFDCTDVSYPSFYNDFNKVAITSQ